MKAAKPTTLAAAFDLLLEQATAEGRWSRLASLKKHRGFILRRLGPATELEALEEDSLRRFIVEQLASSGPKATKRRLSTLAQALRVAHEEGLSPAAVDVSGIARELFSRKKRNVGGRRETVTVAEAARTLGVSRATVLRLEELGTLTGERTPGGHRRFRVSDLAALAERRSRQPQAEPLGDLLAGPAELGTLKEALQHMIARFSTMVADVERSAASLGMHQQHARYLLDRMGPSTRLADIDEAALDRFVAAERAGRRIGPDGELRTLKPGTIKKRLFTLRVALKLAKRRKLIDQLPEWPRFTLSYKPRKRFLRSFAEYRRLFEALPLPWAEWMSVCLWTAQHAGDVERMTWEDCDPFASPPWMFVRNTKNRRDGIRVKMPKPLAAVLRAKWLRERPERAAPIVGRWSNRGHQLPKVCRRLGLPELASIDLRHTGLSWMIRKKGITKAAMEFAGHSSPTMMAKIYGHALPLQLLEVVEDLESMEHEAEAPIDLGRALPTAGPGPSLSYPIADDSATAVAERATEAEAEDEPAKDKHQPKSARAVGGGK